MSKSPICDCFLTRAEVDLLGRRFPAYTQYRREASDAPMLQLSPLPRRLASVPSEIALVASLKQAFRTRKMEERLTQAKLARLCGKDASAVGRILSGRDWRTRSLLQVAGALDLSLEFAFVDRRNPGRRFTASGIECAQDDVVEPAAGLNTRRW